MSFTGFRFLLGLASALVGGIAAASCTNDAYCFDCQGTGGGNSSGGGSDAGTGGSKGCTGDKDCSGGKKCCNADCLDEETDLLNCGGCGTTCDNAANAGAACVAGKCGLACATGYADCDHLASDGCEAHLAFDPANCGTCGKACSYPNAQGSCTNGKCAFGACDVGFADCNNDPKDGCEVNLGTDPANCSKCGDACMAAPHVAPTCTVGVCGGSQCDLGYANCDMIASNGCEIDVLTDPTNCGGCGDACPALQDATVKCSNGGCAIDACLKGFGDCDHLVYDGCEADLSSDTNNCSTCGMVCPAVANGSPGCAGGACGVSACNPGYADCDKDPTNGCEVNLATDAANCGTCKLTCPSVDNGTPSCSDFVCGIGACNAGYANCFGGEATGCATNLNTDAGNCGKCGIICPVLAEATSACTMGTCGIGTCTAGFGDCDNMAADGCEANFATDVNNCGMCGHMCPTPAHGVAGCAAGTCTLAGCMPGYSDCDHDPTNGCELDTLVDANNCGGCGITCGSGTCANSACVCTKKVLVLADDSQAGAMVLGAALKTPPVPVAPLLPFPPIQGWTVVVSPGPSYNYDGTNPALCKAQVGPCVGNFGAVVVLAGGPQGTSYTTDMLAAGQAAIVAFANAGNGVVFTEWAAYEVANSHWQTLAQLVLLTRSKAYTGQVDYTVDAGFVGHPVWANLPGSLASPMPASFTFATTSNVGITKLAPGVTRIAGSQEAIDAVAIRDVAVGRVVHLAHAGNYAPNGWTNPAVQTLVANAVAWSARCD